MHLRHASPRVSTLQVRCASVLASCYSSRYCRSRSSGIQSPSHCRAKAGDADAGTPLRIWAVSDVHTDYVPNLEWVDSLKHRDFGPSDVLLLAGDATEDVRVLRKTLVSLRDTFGSVFFLPGNHELWLRGGPSDPRNGGARDSFEKLQLIFRLCEELGIHTRPQRLGHVWIVPLQSWHHRSFDREPEVAGLPAAAMMGIADYNACVWPDSIPGGREAGSVALAEWMDGLNEGQWDEAQRGSCDIISMSHFLPHQELLPEKRFLYFPHLAKAAGSDPLAARLAVLRPDIHVFGHTHFGWNSSLNGTRYIQAALAYPSERRRRLLSLAIHDASVQIEPTDPGAAVAPPDWLPALIYTSDAGETSQAAAADGKLLQEGDASKPSSRASTARVPAESDARDTRQLRHGRMCAERLQASWSEYYQTHPRDPSNTELAPWVVNAFKRRRRQRRQEWEAANES